MSMAEDTRKRPDFSDHPTDAAPAGDPLAELARLIGQSDPFTDLSKRAARKPLDSVKNDDRPAPEWLARPAAPPEPEYDEPHAPQGYRAEQYDEPAQHQAPADYRAHAAAYTKQIQAVDDWARTEIAEVPAGKRRALSSHDSLQYIARAYGITLLSVNGWTSSR